MKKVVECMLYMPAELTHPAKPEDLLARAHSEVSLLPGKYYVREEPGRYYSYIRVTKGGTMADVAVHIPSGITYINPARVIPIINPQTEMVGTVLWSKDIPNQ